jgi:hypothetical protein
VDCGEDCLNRILRIECCDTKIKAAAGEGRGSGDQCICAIGGRCSNRALQNRKYAKTEPFREFQMGWGLRAKVGVLCCVVDAILLEGNLLGKGMFATISVTFSEAEIPLTL